MAHFSWTISREKGLKAFKKKRELEAGKLCNNRGHRDILFLPKDEKIFCLEDEESEFEEESNPGNPLVIYSSCEHLRLLCVS